MNWNIKWTDDKKEKAINKLTEYFGKHGPGECIMQDDDSIIEAPDYMAYIADVILKEGEGIIYIDND
jgi:hypothetical protein